MSRYGINSMSINLGVTMLITVEWKRGINLLRMFLDLWIGWEKKWNVMCYQMVYAIILTSSIVLSFV